MKKIINIFISACLLSSTISSCSDMLDSSAKSALEEEVIFSNVGLSEGMITAILHALGETNAYRGRLIHFYGSNSDLEWYSSAETISDDRAQLTGYGANPTNLRLNNSNSSDPWSKVYQGVERANLAIRGFETYSDIENNADFAQLYGEALTLRAFLYYDLIKFWGDVPARFEPVTNETIYIPRSDRDDILKQIIYDLGVAGNYMGWPNENYRTNSVENASKAFAKGLRARAALMAAGYSQRYTGEIRESNDSELSKDVLYPIVKQECLDIINSRTLTLADFEENFKDLCKDVISAGRESIWEMPFSDTRGQVVYGYGIRHRTNDQYVGINQGGIVRPVPTLYYDYEEGDIRRDITCIPYDWNNGVQSAANTNVSDWYFGKYRYEWMNRRIINEAGDDGVNWQVMRLADIYLMAAEAINYLQGPDAAAPYLQAIRERAFPNNPEKVTAYMQQITGSKEVFQEAIENERALEFAGEMLRKADLIRWNKLKSNIDITKSKMYELQERTGNYSDLNERVYYKLKEDGETLLFYGLNRGELDAMPEPEWDNKNWYISNSAPRLSNEKIEAIYQRNPDQYQYWPIFQVILDASNNMLTNEINYYGN